MSFFSQRIRRSKKIQQPQSLFSSSPLANILLCGFIATDTICFYSMWNVIITENPIMLVSIALSIAAVVDLPMSIAGSVTAQARDGVRNKNEAKTIVIGCLLTFLLTFIFSLLLRILTKDLTISISSSDSGLVSMIASAEADSDENNSPVSLCASAFLAVIPCCTSTVSFFVSLTVTDCISDRIKCLECQRIGIQTEITELRQALSECTDADSEFENLVNRENLLYGEFLEEINSMKLIIKQQARLVIMEKIGDPDSISAVTQSARVISESSAADFQRNPIPSLSNSEFNAD